jgi:hypothetical protein
MSLISRLGVVLGLDAGEFNKNLGIAQQRLQGFNQSIIGSRLGVAAIATGFAYAATSAIRFADGINDIAQSSELSVQTVLRLNEAITTNGGKADAASIMVSKFSRSVYEANHQNEDMQKSFKKLGISMEDLRTKSMEQLFAKGLKGFGQLKDITEKTGVAFDIFGKSAKGVDFSGAADSFARNKEAYKDAQRAFDAIGNALDNLQKISFTMKTGFAIQIGEAFEYVTDKAIDFYNTMAKIKKFLTDNLGDFAKLVPGAIYMPNQEITKRGPNDKTDDQINREQELNKETLKRIKTQEEFYRKELMITEAKRKRVIEEQGLLFIGESEKNLALALFDIEQKRLLLIQEKKMNPAQANEWAQSEKNLAHFTYQTEQSQKTFEFGWKMAFKKYAENAADSAKQAEQAFVGLAQSLEDTLTTFFETGKLNFRGFITSILHEMARLQAQKAASSILGLFGGGSGGGIGGFISSLFGGGVSPAFGSTAFWGGKAGGGDINGPSMVGENGPELFIPKSAGTIVPNNRINSLMGNQPQVVYNGPYIANMQAIDTQSGLQFLAKNKQGVWAANQSAQRSLPQSR